MIRYRISNSPILDRMFDNDRHTKFLYEKWANCATDAERDVVDREIHEWWSEWKEYQN